MKNILNSYNRMSIITHKRIQNLSPILINFNDVDIIENQLIYVVNEIERLINTKIEEDSYITYISELVKNDLFIITEFEVFYPGLFGNIVDFIFNIIDETIIECEKYEKYEAASNLSRLKKKIQTI